MNKKDYFKLLIFIKNAEKIKHKIPSEQRSMFDKNLQISRSELEKMIG